MPEDVTLLMCLNCDNYASPGKNIAHENDCCDHVIVEVITQQVGVYCEHCGITLASEPGTCACGFVCFRPVYKHPTASRMEEYIHILMDTLAKIQGGPELREMLHQQPPENDDVVEKG